VAEVEIGDRGVLIDIDTREALDALDTESRDPVPA
jgi:hypothetical protein